MEKSIYKMNRNEILNELRMLRKSLKRSKKNELIFKEDTEKLLSEMQDTLYRLTSELAEKDRIIKDYSSFDKEQECLIRHFMDKEEAFKLAKKEKRLGTECCRLDRVEVQNITVITALRGSGKLEEDPCRHIQIYYDADGKYLFEIDTWETLVK